MSKINGNTKEWLKNNKILMGILFIEIFIIVAFALKGYSNGHKKFEVKEILVDNNDLRCDFVENKNNSYSIDERVDIGQDEIVFTYGPYMALESGFYKATIMYEATEDNGFRVYSNSDMSLEHNKIVLPKDKTEMAVLFSLNKSIEDLEFHTLYEGKGSFTVKGIRIDCASRDEYFEANSVYGADKLLSNNGKMLDDEWVISPDMVGEVGDNIVFSYGPYVYLPAGDYKVVLNYTTDENQEMRLYSNELISSDFNSTTAKVDANENTTELEFHLNNGISDFELQTLYNGRGEFRVEGIEIEQVYEMDNSNVWIYRTILIITMFVLLDIAFLYIKKEKENGIIVGALVAITFFAVYPFMSKFLFYGHDINFHVLRIQGLCDEMSKGRLLIKMQPGWYNGYGYPVGVFYPDILLYIPAFLCMAGFEIITSFKIFVGIITFITTIISYVCFKTIYGKKMGIVAACLYVLSSYRLIDVFLREAVGEYCAIAFLPLFVLGFYHLFRDEHKKAMLVLILACTGIVETHVLTTEIVAVFIVIYCLIYFKEVIRLERFKTLVATVIAALILNAGFLVPLIDYMFTGNISYMQADGNQFSLQSRGVWIAQLFNLFPDANGICLELNAGTMAEEMPLTIGVALLAGLTLGLFTLGVTEGKRKALKTYIILGALATFMGTAHFPWDAIGSVPFMHQVVNAMQYPWRIFAVATLFLILCICESLKLLENTKYKEYKNYAIVVVVLLSVITAGWFANSVIENDELYMVNGRGDLDYFNSAAGDEYVLTGTKSKPENLPGTYSGENVEIYNYNKKDLYVEFEFESKENASVTLPVFNYKYYRCYYTDEITGKKTMLPLENGYNNFIKVILPNNAVGSASVGFYEPIWWKMACWLSFITVIVIVCVTFKMEKQSDKNLQASNEE